MQSVKIGSQHQPTLFSIVRKTQPHHRNGSHWTELTETITYLIAKDGLPLYMVEKSGFKKMTAVFNPKYEVTSLGQVFQLFMLPPIKD